MRRTLDSRVFFVLAAALAVLVGAAGGCTGPRKVSDRDLEPIGLAELRQLINASAAEPEESILYLVDPRRKQRFDEGHLPGARHLLLSEVPLSGGRDPAVEAYGFIVVYGDNPGSVPARAMAKRLMSLRYDDVYWFERGVEGWTAAGLPLVTEVAVGTGEAGE